MSRAAESSSMTGTDLRAARLSRGLTQQQLADALGVTRNSVARWERGELTIRAPKMLAAALQAIPLAPKDDSGQSR